MVWNRGGIFRFTRRRLLGLGTLTALTGACRPERRKRGAPMATGGQDGVGAGAAEGHLLARPVGGVSSAAPTGLQDLDAGSGRGALLYVPAGYDAAARPAPLAVLLHGAGGAASGGLDLLRRRADATGLILLAPASQGRTWDVILGAYGPDADAIDRALAYVFTRYAVDPARVAVGGFSDGASYALSLGVSNGGLFTHVIAFSPGFMAPTRQEASPRVFVSHGTKDRVLSIDRCSRRLVPQLKRAGYDVRYREFDGPHTVPESIAQEALDWFVPS